MKINHLKVNWLLSHLLLSILGNIAIQHSLSLGYITISAQLIYVVYGAKHVW